MSGTVGWPDVRRGLARAVVVALCLLIGACRDPPPAASGTSGASPSSSKAITADRTDDRPRPSTAPQTADTQDVAPMEPSALDSPEAVGAALAAAEDALRAPSTPEVELERWGVLQQEAYRKLLAHPDWRPAARALVAPHQEAFDSTLQALDALTLLTEGQPELPAWRIVPPRPLHELRELYQATGAEFGIDWTYLAAIHFVETRFSRIQGTSTAGAQGPMQFIPSTWEIYGEGDITDDHDSVRAAARYLVASGAPGDMADALYHYNPSQRYVDAIGAYARVIRADEAALAGYYHWRIYYRLESGPVLLEEGYGTG